MSDEPPTNDAPTKADAPASPPPHQTALQRLLDPIVIIALSIQVAVFVLIGAAIFGWDKGHVLVAMSGVTFARGLITYLFTTITAGTAVVLVVSALTTANDKVHQERFQRGKEVLSLLLGVFGTIVGFYFGSEVGAKGAAEERALELAPFHISKTNVASGDNFTLTTVVTGGRPPYQFSIAIGDAPEITENSELNGWITKDLKAPEVDTQQSLVIKIVVKDVDGHEIDRTSRITVHPKGAKGSGSSP